MKRILRVSVLVLAGLIALFCLTACGGDRAVVGKRHVGSAYYIDCRTGYKDVGGKKEALITHQVVTKAKFDAAKEGDDC